MGKRAEARQNIQAVSQGLIETRTKYFRCARVVSGEPRVWFCSFVKALWLSVLA